MSSVPAKPKTAAERLEALARSASNIAMLKYNSGNWSISDMPVPANTRFALYPDQVSHSWTQFSDGKVVAEITAVVADDDEGDSELRIVNGKAREDLGSDDQSNWKLDPSGKKVDPWVYGFGLPMLNLTTGALVVFKTSSAGGMGAVAGQVASFTRNRRLGYPIVTLSTDTYKNKRYGGFTSFPVFVQDGYEKPPEPVTASHGGNGGDGARVIGASAVRDREVDDMSDDIPL
jgi:hypothetical protein